MTHIDAPGVALPEAHAVEFSRIESELARLQHDVPREGPVPPARAWMSNVVVFCGEGEDLERVAQDVHGVANAHPSRVILLATSQGPGKSGIQAWVSTCPFVSRNSPAQRRRFSEFILLRISQRFGEGLPAAVRSLLIGDLPTALWWTPTDQAPPGYGRLFEQLLPMMDHFIYDSRGWIDAPSAVIAMANWATDAAPKLTISDLAWRRLEPWRTVIGQGLSPAIAPGALETIEELQIEHGPHALPQAWLLIGWLADRLSWRLDSGKLDLGNEVTWNFASEHGPIRVTVRRLAQGEPLEIEGVTVRWVAPSIDGEGGGSIHERFERLGHERIGVMGEPGLDGPRIVVAPRRTRAALVANELPHRGSRPLFSESLQISRVMAEALKS